MSPDVGPRGGGVAWAVLGRWEAVSDPAGATGGFTFALDVQQHVIVRKNYSNTPAQQGRPAARHDDLMVIFLEGATVKAEYFDSEGHVIRYIAESTPDAVVFVSEASPTEPRYRLTYRRRAGGMLDGAFEVAAPGKPNEFGSYLSWRARKHA